MPKFGPKSRENLKTCHQDLQLLFNTVVREFDCSVTDGHRTAADQTAAFRAGKSKAKWPESKHNKNPSMAVDVVPYPVDYEDINRFYRFAGYVQAKAEMLGIKVKWGGDFENLFDGPHWELI